MPVLSRDEIKERLERVRRGAERRGFNVPSSRYSSGPPREDFDSGGYVVQPGDSYSGIAERFYGKDPRHRANLQQANPRAPRLHPGMRIVLPGRRESTFTQDPPVDFWKQPEYERWLSDESKRIEEVDRYDFNFDRYERLTQVERKPLIPGQNVYYGYDPDAVNPQTNEPGVLYETSDPAGAQLFWNPEGNSGEGGVLLDANKLPPAWGLPSAEVGQPYIHGIQDQNRLGTGLQRSYYDINPEVRSSPTPPSADEMRQAVIENDLGLLNQQETVWQQARRDILDKNPELKILPQDKLDSLIFENATRPPALETVEAGGRIQIPWPDRDGDSTFTLPIGSGRYREAGSVDIRMGSLEIDNPFDKNDTGVTVYGVGRDNIEEPMPITLRPHPFGETVGAVSHEAGNILFDEGIAQFIGTGNVQEGAQLGVPGSVLAGAGDLLLALPRLGIAAIKDVFTGERTAGLSSFLKESAEVFKEGIEAGEYHFVPEDPDSAIWKELKRIGNSTAMIQAAYSNPNLNYVDSLSDEERQVLVNAGFVFKPTEGIPDHKVVGTLDWQNHPEGEWESRNTIALYKRGRVEPLRQEAQSKYVAAFNAQEAGNPEAALQLVTEAQAADARSRTIQNPYFTYTWGARPELEENFLTSTALIALQLGRPLSDREVQLIRYNYEDLSVELPMRIALDTSNVIPIIPFAIDELKWVGRSLGRAGRFIDEISLAGITAKIPEFDVGVSVFGKRFGLRGQDLTAALPKTIADLAGDNKQMGRAFSWLTQDTPHVAGRRIGTQATNSILQLNLPFSRVSDIPQNLPKHFSLEGHLDTIGKYISGGKPTSGPIFDAWNALPISSKTHVTNSLEQLFRVFDPLLDNKAMQLIDPENAGNFVRKAINEVITDETKRLWGLRKEKLTSAIAKARRISDESARIIAVKEAEEAMRIALATEGPQITAQAQSLARKPGQLAAKIGTYFRAASDASNAGRMSLSDRAISGFFDTFSDNIKFVDLNPRLQESVLLTTKGANKFLNKIKGLWFSGVLSTVPRWTINNIIDSAFRMVSAGGHITDDLQTSLIYALDKGILDEGLMTTFVSYARGGSELNVPGELVRAILSAKGKKLGLMRDVVIKEALWEAIKKHPLKTPLLIPEALNQYFEFSYRLRLHKTLFQQAYETLDDIALGRILNHLNAAGATDVSIDAFRAAWTRAGPDATKLEDLLNILSTGDQGVVGRINSLKFPDGIDDMMRAAGINREVRYSLLDVLASRLEASNALGSGTRSGKLRSMHTTLDDLLDEIDVDLIERLKGLDDTYKPYGDLSVEDARQIIRLIQKAGDDTDELIDVARVANVDTEFIDEIIELAQNASSKIDEETIAEILKRHTEYTEFRRTSDELARTLSGGIRLPVADVQDELRAAGLSDQMIENIFTRRTLTGRARRLRQIWRQEQLTGDLDALTQRLMTVEVPDPLIRTGQVIAGEGNEAAGLTDDILVGNIGQRVHPPDPHAQAGIDQAAIRFDAEDQIRTWNDEVIELSEKIDRGEDVKETAQQMALITRKSAYVQSAIERATFVRDKIRRFALEAFPGPLLQEGVGRERAFDAFFEWDREVYRGIGKMIEDARALADAAENLDDIPARVERTLDDYLKGLNVTIHWRNGKFNGMELKPPGGQSQWTHIHSRVTDDLLGRFFPETTIQISDAEALLNRPYTPDLVAEVLESSVRLDRNMDDAVQAADAYYFGVLADTPDIAALPHQIEEARRLSLDWGDGTIFRVQDTDGNVSRYVRTEGKWQQLDAAGTRIGDPLKAGSDEIAELVVRSKIINSPEWGDLSHTAIRRLFEIDDAAFKAMVEEHDWATKFGEEVTRDRNTFINYLKSRLNELAGGAGEAGDAYIGPLYLSEFAKADEVAEARRLSKDLPIKTTIEELNDTGSAHYWRKTDDGWREIGGGRLTQEEILNIKTLELSEGGQASKIYGSEGLGLREPRTISQDVGKKASISKKSDGSYRKGRVPSRTIYVESRSEADDALKEIARQVRDDIAEIVIRPTKKGIRKDTTALKRQLSTLGFDRKDIAEFIGTVRDPGYVRLVTQYGDKNEAKKLLDVLDEVIKEMTKTGNIDLDALKEVIKSEVSSIVLHIPDAIYDDISVGLTTSGRDITKFIQSDRIIPQSVIDDVVKKSNLDAYLDEIEDLYPEAIKRIRQQITDDPDYGKRLLKELQEQWKGISIETAVPAKPLKEKTVRSSTIDLAEDAEFERIIPSDASLAEERRIALEAGDETLGANVVDPESEEALRLLLFGQEIGEPAPASAIGDFENIIHDVEQARRRIFSYSKEAGIGFMPEARFTLPRYQLPDFIRTRYEFAETAVGQAQASKQFLRDLRPMLRSKIEANDIGFTRLLLHDAEPIKDISGLAITTKQSIKSTALRGLDDGMLGVSDEMRPFIDELYEDAIGRGTDLTGSLPRTNKAMIDYASENNFDSIMRNPFPFWRFQSKSPVYWAGWMAKHPWAASAYFKHLKYSRVSQIEAGVVNRRGEPAYPAGYIRLPYTDSWINPLAPLSFRVIFPTRTPFGNEGSGNELVTMLTEWSNVYGVSAGPWTLEAFYQLGWLDPDMVPRRSIVPALDLVPIYWQRALENKFNQIERPTDGHRWGAENPWLDGQIENQMMKDALEEMRENPQRAQAVLVDLGRALGYRPRGRDEFGAPIWDQAQFDPVRDHVRWEEAQRTIEAIGWKARFAGYMAGAYFRTFSDEDAEMRAVELEANFLRDAVNNAVGANYFALDPRPERRYEIWKAINYGASPEELDELGITQEEALEGQLTSFAGSLRWVTAPEGERLFGVDRREQLVQELHTRQVTSAYFDSIKATDARREAALAQLPTGADKDLTDPIWVQWKEERDAIDSSPIFAIAEIPSFKIGIRPEVMLEEHYLDQQMWTLSASRPKYDPIAAAEDPDYYLRYQLEIRVWETETFATLQATVDEAIVKQVEADIAQYEFGLPGDQDLNPAQMGRDVSKQITLENYYAWKQDRDTIYDAADNVWQEEYLDVWWDTVGSLSGYERELAQREFDQQYGDKGLTIDDYVAGILDRYGDKWTEAEIRSKLGPRETLTVEDRLGAAEGSPEEQQEIGWDLLLRVPPGSIARKELSAALVAVGGDPDQLQTWYDTGGEWMFSSGAKASAKAQQFLIDLDAAIKEMNLPNPSDETLREWQQVRELDAQFKEERDGVLTQYYGPEWNDLMQTYFNLPSRSAERRKFNKDNPGLVDDYYELRCDFGASHELWADYNLDPEKDCKPRGGGGGGRGRSFRGRGGGRGGRRGTSFDASGVIPQGYRAVGPEFGRSLFDVAALGTGGIGGPIVAWPPGYGAGTPNGVLKDLIKKTESGEPVSEATKTYLKNTANQKEEQVEKYLSIAAPGGFNFRSWLNSVIDDRREAEPVHQLYSSIRPESPFRIGPK